jgi:hypothetical protein
MALCPPAYFTFRPCSSSLGFVCASYRHGEAAQEKINLRDLAPLQQRQRGQME